LIDAGQEVRTYDVVATRNGQRVEINTGRGIVEVTARFMASRILALVEHPAAAPNIAQEVLSADGAGSHRGQ
jgi:hypothetical protein